MAYISNYNQEEPRQAAKSQIASTTEQRAIAADVPPVAEITTITADEYHAIRTSYQLTTIQSIRLDPTKNEADELRHMVATIGHSRALAPQEFINICRLSFRNGQKVPAEQWLKLRDSTFPFSILTADEQREVNSNLVAIIALAVTGLCVMTVYLAIELKKLERNQKPTYILLRWTPASRHQKYYS